MRVFVREIGSDGQRQRVIGLEKKGEREGKRDRTGGKG